jgi:competence protein ComEC
MEDNTKVSIFLFFDAQVMRPRIRRLSLLLCLVMFLGLGALRGQTLAAGTVQVSFIDVGQGDAALLQDPSGFDILIDGGPAAAGPAVLSTLRARVVDSLEVIFNTHADADHVGGLITVLQASDIAVGAIFFNGYPGTTATWNQFSAAAAARSLPLIPAQFPLVLHWGSFDVYILNPSPGMVTPEQNKASVVARIDFNSARFLFPGDIDSTVEATVVARGTPVAAQVLKVAHHGSAYSTSSSFLTAVQPQDAVISVGPNIYGHPAPETLARLSSAAVRVWRTDRQGTILVSSDGFSLNFPALRQVYLPFAVR